MEVQSWFATSKTILSQPTSNFWPSSSYTCAASSSEIQSNSTFCEEKSFTSSFRSNASLNIDVSYHTHHGTPMPSLSHLCIASLRSQTPRISCLAVHDNALYAASLNEINVFDLTDYTLMDTFSCSRSASGLVKSIAFGEEKIFTGHQDCKIRVWKVTESKQHHLVSTLPTMKDCLRRCILPKNYVQVRRHKQKLWIEHVDTISGLALNNGLMYSISWDKCFKIWNMSDHCCLESVKAHEDAINAIVVSADGIVYTASADGHIKVWEKANGEKKHTLVNTLEEHSSNVNALALSNDGSMLFSGGSDRNILVWERENNDNQLFLTIWSLTGHTNAILCLTYIDDLLISGSADRTIRVWKRGVDCGYCCLAVLEGHSKPIKSIVAVSDEQANGVVTIFSGSLDGEIKVWKLTVSTLNRMSSAYHSDQFHI